MRSLSIHSEADDIPRLCDTRACVLIPLYYYHHFEFLRITSRHYDEKINRRFKWVLDCKRYNPLTNQGKAIPKTQISYKKNTKEERESYSPSFQLNPPQSFQNITNTNPPSTLFIPLDTVPSPFSPKSRLTSANSRLRSLCPGPFDASPHNKSAPSSPQARKRW